MMVYSLVYRYQRFGWERVWKQSVQSFMVAEVESSSGNKRKQVRRWKPLPSSAVKNRETEYFSPYDTDL
jgi:hypothetical protein